MAELLPVAVIEAGAGQLGEAPHFPGEADLQRGAGLQRSHLLAADRDLDRLRAPPGGAALRPPLVPAAPRAPARLAARRVADGEHIAGGDDEGARGERVR